MSWDPSILQKRGKKVSPTAKGYSVSLYPEDFDRAQALMAQYGIPRKKGSSKGFTDLFLQMMRLAEEDNSSAVTVTERALLDLREEVSGLTAFVRESLTIGGIANMHNEDVLICTSCKEEGLAASIQSGPKMDASEIHNHKGMLHQDVPNSPTGLHDDGAVERGQ